MHTMAPYTDYFSILAQELEHVICRPLSPWMSTSPYMALNLSLQLSQIQVKG